MSTLEEELEKFHKEFEKLKSVSKDQFEKEINNLFEDLAEKFLYGGYILVKYGDEKLYQIFIRCVEFYCHREGSEESLPKDPIVYHRNDHYVEGEVPYFPLMSFHAHASGIDITFENKDLKLRSSALIRAYEVFDVKNNKYLCYDRCDKIFRPCEPTDKRVNTQSTYLYNFLNGFIGDSVVWIDKPRPKHKNLSVGSRKNVKKYDDAENKLPKQPDNRQWRFTREEEIPV